MSYRDEDYHLYGGIDFTEHSGIDFSKYSLEELKKLWRATLRKGMHGICFSMYEDGQEPGDIISEEQVERRIKILKPQDRIEKIKSYLSDSFDLEKLKKAEK